jgi:hypothetical protein
MFKCLLYNYSIIFTGQLPKDGKGINGPEPHLIFAPRENRYFEV